METRITTGFHVNHQNDDDVLIEDIEDVEPTLDHCARMRRSPQRKTVAGWRKIGSIPGVIYNEWVRQGITRDKTRLRRALDEYSKFKTVDRKLYIPTRVQKRIYSETGIIQ